MNKKLKIGIIGLGMVGAPLARWFQKYKKLRRGVSLFLYDKDPAKKYSDDVNKADIVFVAVPTPPSADGSADLSILNSAVKMISGNKIIVIKSTVPPGTTEDLRQKYVQHKFLFNPEFLTEKNAWKDFLHPTRQIVGFTSGNKKEASVVLSFLPKAPFASPVIRGNKNIALTATEAELVKYGGNVYLSRKINFANILASFAENLGANYENIRAGVAADSRIRDSHLDVNHSGYKGFGGFCFPKDINAFIAALETRNLKDCAKLLRQDMIFNEKLLASQGLTLKDVSVHDHVWVKGKMGKNRKGR